MQAQRNTYPLDTFGDRVRAAKQASKLTDVKVAERIGMSRFTVAAWQNNTVKSPDEKNVRKFCELTEVSLEWLVKGIGEVPPIIQANSMIPPRQRGPRAGQRHTGVYPPAGSTYAMTEDEAARFLRIKPETLRALSSAGLMPTPQLMYDTEEIKEALKNLPSPIVG